MVFLLEGESTVSLLVDCFVSPLRILPHLILRLSLSSGVRGIWVDPPWDPRSLLLSKSIRQQQVEAYRASCCISVIFTWASEKLTKNQIKPKLRENILILCLTVSFETKCLPNVLVGELLGHVASFSPLEFSLFLGLPSTAFLFQTNRSSPPDAYGKSKEREARRACQTKGTQASRESQPA